MSHKVKWKTWSGAAALMLIGFASAAPAQQAAPWNHARALELIDRARIRRDLPQGDSTLRNYSATARGFVYFYLDRREDDERTLVKVDQIALELYWKHPDITKQRIVGMRDVDRLPNRMYYHLDHLTVVQNGLGDVIRIGDGDEVRDVPHPAASGADSVYDYRLADSVTLQLGGGGEQGTVRVYEIQVRPKRTNRSALIGSVFVDRATADIVRMTFTFTPASYVDRRLDYINISLDNGLFDGRYWLPAEQSVEIRRQLPELDFAAGAVIKGRLRIGQYAFNQPMPDTVFWGLAVTAAPEAERKAFPFEEDIYAGVNEEGLAPTARMQELQELAAELVGESRLSGLPPVRLYVPNASSVLRHNDAEGWYGGVGLTYVASPTLRADFTGGYAFGAERPEISATVRRSQGDVVVTGSAYYNQPRDIGPFPGVPGLVNTLWSAFGDHDYTDIYFARGISVRAVDVGRPWRPGILLAAETHTAVAGEGSRFTGTRPTLLEIAGTVERAVPDHGNGWGSQGHLGLVRLRGLIAEDAVEMFVRFNLGIDRHFTSGDQRRTLITRLDAGAHGGPTEAQFDYLIGGRGSFPGIDYRELRATAFLLARAELAQTIAYPWIRGRAQGSFLLSPSENIHGYSFGLGAGLLWDVIRVDVVRAGLDDLSSGGVHWRPWRTMVSIRPDLWDML